MKHNKICVYAICKNELKFADKWLDNMSEADYIVILDTGSTDGCYEYLKNDPRVTKVKQKLITPWRFDVARNESMKLVPSDADILVCTDFDELFNKGWSEAIREAWGENNQYNRVFYTYAWSHNEVGEPTDIFTYDKVHNRDFKWKFPVHEVLWPIDEETTIVKAIDIGNKAFLEHYPDNTKSRSNYFDLLKLSVEENPEDSHTRMLLAREYLLNSDYDNALENYLAVLKLPDVDESNKKLVLLESLGRCADLYKIKNNYDESIWYCQEFIKEDYTYREPYLIMAEIYNEMKMYSLAEACVNEALKVCTRKNTWVERADTWIALPDDILSVSKYYLGDIDGALIHIQKAIKHHPDDVRLLKNYNVYLNAKIQQNEQKLASK